MVVVSGNNTIIMFVAAVQFELNRQLGAFRRCVQSCYIRSQSVLVLAFPILQQAGEEIQRPLDLTGFSHVGVVGCGHAGVVG